MPSSQTVIFPNHKNQTNCHEEEDEGLGDENYTGMNPENWRNPRTGKIPDCENMASELEVELEKNI